MYEQRMPSLTVSRLSYIQLSIVSSIRGFTAQLCRAQIRPTDIAQNALRLLDMNKLLCLLHDFGGCELALLPWLVRWHF